MKLDASFTAFPIPRKATWTCKKETKEEIKKHERGWKKNELPVPEENVTIKVSDSSCEFVKDCLLNFQLGM